MLTNNILITIIIISDNEYITSGKDGLVLKDVAHDKTYVLLDPQKKVSTRYDSQTFIVSRRKRNIFVGPVNTVVWETVSFGN